MGAPRLRRRVLAAALLAALLAAGAAATDAPPPGALGVGGSAGPEASLAEAAAAAAVVAAKWARLELGAASGAAASSRSGVPAFVDGGLEVFAADPAARGLGPGAAQRWHGEAPAAAGPWDEAALAARVAAAVAAAHE
jgi:hypothetical protein